MSEEQKGKLATLSFWICLSASIAGLTAGFLAPPTGVIDPSVLTAVGELFAFAALGVGYEAIRLGRNLRISKGDMVAEITRKRRKGEGVPPDENIEYNGKNQGNFEENLRD